MPGALLRSGEAREFQALGADGQPVYSAALPLRETIRLKLGTDAANCLALVQPSESGERFDWYAPFEGDVIPWSSATDEERRDALAKLETLHRDLLTTAQRMQDDTANREKQIFARLLRKAMYFPSSEHVYLVNGKPVVTFWGFAAQGAETPNPLLYLRPPPVPVKDPDVSQKPLTGTQTTPIQNPPAKKKSFWRWLRWLLLLLLLLLLVLFLLRACVPQVKLPFGLDGIDLPGLPSVNLPDMPNMPDIGLPKLPDINGSGADAGGNLDGMSAAEGNGALPQTDNPVAEMPSLLDAQQQADGQPPMPLDASGEQPPSPPEIPPAQLQPAPPGNPLSIPQQAMQNGSTDFLDGKWRAGAGIQDAQTGQPLRLDYEFENGQGEVRIQRGDGVECRGPVAATMQGGRLGINSQGQARCSDGSRYSMPQVQCQTGAEGADCQGSYQNQRFPMSMRKNENGK